MDKNLSRALRRHHKNRLKNSRRNYWSVTIDLIDLKSEKYISQVTRTPKPCSCYMCGNARKFFNERTLQEKKQQDIFKSYFTTWPDWDF